MQYWIKNTHILQIIRVANLSHNWKSKRSTMYRVVKEVRKNSAIIKYRCQSFMKDENLRTKLEPKKETIWNFSLQIICRMKNIEQIYDLKVKFYVSCTRLFSF